jgi:signal transduction histidine kinase
MVGVRGALVMVAAGFGMGAVPVYFDQPAFQWLPDLIVGLAAMAVAVVTWQSAHSVSAQALVVAATWWAGTVWSGAIYWHRGVFIQLALSVPLAWPRSRAGAAAVVGGYVAAVATPLWQVEWAALSLAATVAAVGIRESWFHHRRGPHAVAPVLFAAAIAVGILMPDLVGPDAGASVALICYDALLLGVLGVVALLARSPSRGDLTDLAVDLGQAPVRDAEALRAMVQAEPGLTADADLRAAVAAALRLENANEQAREQVRAAVVEVDESRLRLVVAAALERGRLARELTSMASGRLRDLQDRAAAAGVAAPALARAADGLEAALLGLRPPGLAHGLAVALREHPLVASLDVTLDICDERCDEVVEDALYAAAVESLTNAAKYAGPSQVAVRYAVAGSQAKLTVTDDGRGGALPGAGTGLTGLIDRLEALGGGLELASPPGVGTVVTAWAPRALTAAGERPPTTASTPVAS